MTGGFACFADAAGYGRAATYNMEEQTDIEIDVRWFLEPLPPRVYEGAVAKQ